MTGDTVGGCQVWLTVWFTTNDAVAGFDQPWFTLWFTTGATFGECRLSVGPEEVGGPSLIRTGGSSVVSAPHCNGGLGG